MNFVKTSSDRWKKMERIFFTELRIGARHHRGFFTSI